MIGWPLKAADANIAKTKPIHKIIFIILKRQQGTEIKITFPRGVQKNLHFLNFNKFCIMQSGKKLQCKRHSPIQFGF